MDLAFGSREQNCLVSVVFPVCAAHGRGTEQSDLVISETTLPIAAGDRSSQSAHSYRVLGDIQRACCRIDDRAYDGRKRFPSSLLPNARGDVSDASGSGRREHHTNRKQPQRRGIKIETRLDALC
jgi:hypothetical protein